MTSYRPQSLLRRTAVAIAAVAAFLVALPASALTVTLSNGQSCTYSGMTVDPSGNMAVTCSAGGTTQPPPVTSGPDTFTLSASVAGAAVNTPFTATITRSGTPSTGNVGLNLAVYGACSSPQAPNPAGGTATFTPTTTTAFQLTINPTATGTCNIMFNIGYGGGTAVNSSMAIPVGATVVAAGSGGTTGGTSGGTTGGTPTVAGCLAPGAGMATTFTMPATPGAHAVNYNGNLVFPSGVVGSAPLPATINGHGSAQLQITYSAFTTAGWQLTEIAISKCPGIIDNTPTTLANGSTTQPQYCYYSSQNPADVSLAWAGKLVGFTTAYLSLLGRCYAPEVDPATGQPLTWYANVRYTYTGDCSIYGSPSCGEMLQWNDSTP